MPINFPNSPLVNDTYTYQGRTWKWTGTAWKIEINATATGYTGSASTVAGYTGSQGAGYTGSLGNTGYTGSSAALTVSLIDPSSNISNIVANVSTIRFDSDAGFDVTDLGSGAVKVGMNSTFKYWEVDGQDTLVATGLDTIEFVAGNNIVLTTNINSSPKSLTIGTNSVLSNVANISAISYANLNITTVSQTAGYNPGEYYDWPVTWTFTQYGELKLPEITSTAAPYSNPYISTTNNKSTGFLIRDNSSPANEYLYKFGTDGITLPNTKGAYGNNNYGELKFDGGLRINTNFSACGSPVFNFTTSGEFVLGGSDRPAFRADPDSPTNLQVRLWNATNSAYSSLTVTNDGAILLGDLDSPYILTANAYYYNSPTWKPLGIQTNAEGAEFTFTTAGEFVAPRIATNGNLDSRGNLRVTTYNFGTSQYDPVFYVEKDTGAIWSQNNLKIEGSANIADYLEVNWGIDSTSTTSGTFRVAGGVGITGNAHIGGNIYAGGLFYSNGAPFVGEVGYTGSRGLIGYTGSAGAGGGGGGSLSPWMVKTANYTAVNGDRIVANTSIGSFYVFLPASPSLGDSVEITDGYNFTANNLIVGANGNTIESQGQDVRVNIRSLDIQFIYDGSTWQIASSFGPIGFTGSTGPIGNTGYIGSAAHTNIGSSPPGNVIEGDFWLNSETTDLYVYYGNSWVGVSSGTNTAGFTGSRGNLGFTGSQGTLGIDGYTGSIGYTGSKGDAGEYAALGYTGSKGDLGYTGSQGVIGPQGTQGVIGYTGSSGSTVMVIAVSDELTPITTGSNKVTLRAPFAMTLTQTPRASLRTASSSGLVVVDVNLDGTSIFGTDKLSIDANEKTSVTAATIPTLTTSVINDDTEISLDVDNAGTGATGLKVSLYYRLP